MEEEFYTPKALRIYRDALDASFHTPLQRLGEEPVNIEQLDHDYTHSTSLPVLEAGPKDQVSRPLNWLETHPLIGERLKYLSQTKPHVQDTVPSGIFSSTKQSDPIYYKPPSHRDSQFGVKEFLPPNYASSELINKVPLFVKTYGNKSDKKKITPDKVVDEELSENEEEINQPTGSYIAPSVKNALMSQVDTQRQVKKIGLSIIFLLMGKLVGKVINVTTDYDPNFFLILWYSLGVSQILLATYELIYWRRGGTTLQLTFKQRQLLGLPPGNANADSEAQDFADTAEIIPSKNNGKSRPMPKYKKLLVQYISGSATSNSELAPDSISVVNGAPVTLQMLKEHTKQFNLPVPQNIKTRFNRKFKLLFDPKNIE